MARTTRGAKSGPGYAGLIVFIVLCLALIAGYAWLVPQYARRGRSLTDAQDYIKRHLEDPLVKAGAKDVQHAKVLTSTADLAYDEAFFQAVRNSALDGVRYNDLKNKTGFAGHPV